MTKNTDEIEILKTPIFTIKEYSRYNKNANKYQKVILVDEPDYVAGVVYNRDSSKYILIRQLRFGINKTLIEFFGGGISPNESPKDAFIRELKEETGYTIGYNYSDEDITDLYVGYFNPGCSKSKIHYYYVEVHGIPLDSSPDEFESLEVVELSYQDVQSIVNGLIGVHAKLAWDLYINLKLRINK